MSKSDSTQHHPLNETPSPDHPSAPPLPQICSLDLSQSPFQPPDLHEFLAWHPNLLRLCLAGVELTKGRLKDIVSACPKLNHLNLSDCREVTGDLKHLAGCKDLERLILRGTQGITGTLKRLRGLHLRTLVLVDMPRADADADFPEFFKHAGSKGAATKKEKSSKGKVAHCPIGTFEDLSHLRDLEVLEIWDELSGGQCKVLGPISDWVGPSLRPDAAKAVSKKKASLEPQHKGPSQGAATFSSSTMPSTLEENDQAAATAPPNQGAFSEAEKEENDDTAALEANTSQLRVLKLQLGDVAKKGWVAKNGGSDGLDGEWHAVEGARGRHAGSIEDIIAGHPRLEALFLAGSRVRPLSNEYRAVADWSVLPRQWHESDREDEPVVRQVKKTLQRLDTAFVRCEFGGSSVVTGSNDSKRSQCPWHPREASAWLDEVRGGKRAKFEGGGQFGLYAPGSKGWGE